MQFDPSIPSALRRFTIGLASCLGLSALITCSAGKELDPGPRVHVTDGKFTSWNEWGMGMPGKYAYMYMDVAVVKGERILYFLNDWLLNTEGPVDPTCYNRFDFFSTTGDTIEVRVFGNHRIAVLWNGIDISAGAEGVAGFGPSPNLPKPHSIFEFQMKAPPRATWSTSLCDPAEGSPPPPPSPPPPVVSGGVTAGGVTNRCEDPSYLIDEPTVPVLEVGESSFFTSSTVSASPLAYALDKYRAVPGDRVTILGRSLTGAVAIHSVGAPRVPEIVAASPTRVTFVVPAGLGEGRVTTSIGGTSGPAFCVCEASGCGCDPRSPALLAGTSPTPLTPPSTTPPSSWDAGAPDPWTPPPADGGGDDSRPK